MSLRVWLPLDGDLRNQGISNYTPTLVSDNTWATSGKIGNKSLTLIKLQTILPTSSCMTGAKEISYCYWIKVNTAWSANWLDGIRWIETNGSATATARQEFYTNCTLIGTWYKGGAISGKSFTPGKWTHLAATFNYNTGEVKFYINGTLSGSASNLDTTYYCRGDFYIGDNGTDICENDVRIYDHCLSAAEVREIAQGLVLHYKLDDGNQNLLYDTPKSVTPTSYCGYQLNMTENLVANQTYTLQLWNVDIAHSEKTVAQTGIWLYWGGGSVHLGNWAGSTYFTEGHADYLVKTFTITSSNASGSGATNAWLNLYNSVGYVAGTMNMHIGAWKLEKGSIATPWKSQTNIQIQDSSGYNHNGICIDTTISSDSPRYNSCISCIGTTVDNSSNTITGAQYFYCNMDMPATNAITIAWWNKITKYGRGGIFETSNSIQTNTTKGTDYNTTAFANWDTTFGIYNGSTRVNIFSNFARDGEWHHHAITFDGVNVKYYCDSILKQTSALTGTLPAWKSFCIGLGKAGGVWRQIQQNVSDFRIYCTPLLDTDIKSLYNIGMKVDKQQNIHAFDIEEKLQNIMYKPNFAIGAQLWQDGLNRYTQTNCQVNLTNNGIYIYRPANLNQTDNGNTMYGGLKIVNSTVDSIHVYDSNIDNIFNLQKGHTYIWIFHIKGNTTNAPSFQINNNMGWGGGGLSPTPSNVTIKNISSNFNGETEVWYKFTINDDIIKTCTSAYSSFVANNQYLSYKHFGWNWSYATTGNGTNIYITNIRLYDITNIPTGKLTKSGIIKFSSIFEVNNTIHLTKNEDLILNQFIER